MNDTACLNAATETLMPDAARRYLAHTADGRPIREIAREAGCHASTVLRQVRKLESLRDDPLVDGALMGMKARDGGDESLIDAATDALRDLCAPGAMMLYNSDLPQPAIVQSAGEGNARVLRTVGLDLAGSLVMRKWIAQEGGTTVKRYRVTQEGRSTLPTLIAARDRRADHALDPEARFEAGAPDRRRRGRTVSSGPGFESPLAILARRRGPDGQPFLTADYVKAGERLYEDYAIAGFRPDDLLGWITPDALHRHYATAKLTDDRLRRAAILRVLDAVRDLGPGLSDVVLRCCCLREGLEAAEKRMGWSARSGKVVLRIALQRLSHFYSGTRSKESALIG
ncbi:DUF6456 domain-containing protein [Marivita sp. GX14005]|uniref:DUF6456 domain-containing protein n=1 Tax=Marivita sp. GX14005 TaxID=2942276 RepID=UPI00201A1A6A|nr:DUF6456 domain-containing protein [Marivita sp. GX14005]MCL3883646.1 DUF6456 domain-containing protein [Marivita sp. GX14005]